MKILRPQPGTISLANDHIEEKQDGMVETSVASCRERRKRLVIVGSRAYTRANN